MNKYLLLIFLNLLLWGCGSDNEDDPEVAYDYYVKYEATVTSRYISNSIEYTVSMEDGLQTFKSNKVFSQTFGPVKRGFDASIAVDASNLYSAECEAKIYVCRGNEPFALKANNSGGKKVSVSYKIDY